MMGNDAQTAALGAALGLLIQHRQAKALYRVERDGATAIRHMTPARAAQYAERYDATVTAIGSAPLAPEGALERGATLAAERPRA